LRSRWCPLCVHGGLVAAVEHVIRGAVDLDRIVVSVLDIGIEVWGIHAEIVVVIAIAVAVIVNVVVVVTFDVRAVVIVIIVIVVLLFFFFFLFFIELLFFFGTKTSKKRFFLIEMNIRVFGGGHTT